MRHSGLILLWVVTVAWAAQIFDFSTATFGGVFTTWLLSQILHLLHVTVSFPTFRLLHHLMRKSAHITEYALFSMLLYCSLGRRSRAWKKKTAICTLVVSALYSLSDEFHQLFVPGRGPSIFDSGIDTLGACLGILIIFLSTRFKKQRPEASASGPAIP
jgi:VanZ family protein